MSSAENFTEGAIKRKGLFQQEYNVETTKTLQTFQNNFFLSLCPLCTIYESSHQFNVDGSLKKKKKKKTLTLLIDIAQLRCIIQMR